MNFNEKFALSAKYLFATNILIYCLKNQYELDLLASFLANASYISIISKIELLSFGYLSGDEESRVQFVLNDFIEVPLSQEVTQYTINFRRKTHLKLPDSIIAATAAVIGATLLTRDHRLLALVSTGFSFPGSLAPLGLAPPEFLSYILQQYINNNFHSLIKIICQN
ncbi:MAG: type II toxin-antitoxin system VapC family toxin [Deltaproteobacteria bacterium]|nr:type II toxin-antitoxin system VapC family toxin [Deltaproteobacteria bacterium]